MRMSSTPTCSRSSGLDRHLSSVIAFPHEGDAVCKAAPPSSPRDSMRRPLADNKRWSTFPPLWERSREAPDEGFSSRRETPHPSRCRFASAIHLLPQGEKEKSQFPVSNEHVAPP